LRPGAEIRSGVAAITAPLLSFSFIGCFDDTTGVGETRRKGGVRRRRPRGLSSPFICLILIFTSGLALMRFAGNERERLGNKQHR